MGDYYFFDESPAGRDVVKVEHWAWGVQVWGKAKMRKVHKCAVTGEDIQKGQTAYRSLGNESNRGDRISEPGMAKLAGWDETDA